MIQATLYNQHRIETHRALELLGDYYAKLTKSQEKQLILEIERLIRVLKSRFFQSLIDIQEFYEVTLLDGIGTTNLLRISSQVPYDRWKFNKIAEHNLSFSNLHENNVDNNIVDNWTYIEIIIQRGETGLGFSIAGGIDNPHLANDFCIYVTKIIPGGAALIDGRLRINDVLDRVNDISVVNVTHAAAVDILKRAGDEVKLYIRRKKYEKDINEVELLKDAKGFGFSIAGGIGNQHIPGDNGIYITKIMDGGAAQTDGRLKVGQKLVAIRNSSGDRDFENITHQEAVEALRSSQDKIILFTKKSDDLTHKSNLEFKKIPASEDASNAYSSYTQSNPKSSSSLITKIDEPSNMIQDTLNDEIRIITLNKGPGGLGFNIVGGEDGEGIFVSFILEDGPAFINGQLRKGDKIISVNGINFLNISHEEAASVLKGFGEKVVLTVEHNIEDYNRFEAKLNQFRGCRSQHSLNIGNLIKTTQKRTLYVRALFDYDPNKDDDLPSLGLPFHFGDILHVTNASDDEWWLATKILSNASEGFGIIPARKRWERKQRARDRSVKFEGHMPVLLDKQSTLDKRKKNYSFSRKFPFMKNKDDKLDDYSEQEPFMLCYTQDDVKAEDPGSKEILYRVELPYMEELTLVYLEKDIDDDDNQQLCGEENILSYEKVQEIIIDYARPIVILGPMKDRINDDLISEYPEKFGSCVPHTTRPKRDNETDGHDYHFIASREEMEQDIQKHLFIEAGQYNENLYGTSIASIKEVAEKGKHCILDVSGNAIKRLYTAHLYPIALFIKVKSHESIMNMNNKITEDQAKKAYYRALRVEQEFAEHFTGIIEGDVYKDIYEEVKESISKQCGPRIWIPCKFQYE